MTEPDDDELLSSIAETLEPVPPLAETRARLLAELKGPARFDPFAAEIASSFRAPLATVLRALRRAHDPNAWNSGLVPGLRLLHVHATETGSVALARLVAGTRIPKHEHATRELTYVLDGELASDGKQGGPGTLFEMLPGSTHAVDVGDSECWVVFASPPPD